MVPVNAQNIAFGYDASGNRISRLQVNKELSLDDKNIQLKKKAMNLNPTNFVVIRRNMQSNKTNKG
jgi:hypothetical protein